MIVMPSNNVGPFIRECFSVYPDRTAQLMSPDGWRPPRHRYALDNGAFKRFDEGAYFGMLDKSLSYDPPMFVVCPDVVGCHDRTLALWHCYWLKIKKYRYPVAFVCQDGCNPEDVPREADWLFIGGTTPWKPDNVHRFMDDGRPVHVGRVNSLGFLKYCESLGVTSVDGTGWMRARGKQYWDLVGWFRGDDQHALLTG